MNSFIVPKDKSHTFIFIDGASFRKAKLKSLRINFFRVYKALANYKSLKDYAITTPLKMFLEYSLSVKSHLVNMCLMQTEFKWLA